MAYGRVFDTARLPPPGEKSASRRMQLVSRSWPLFGCEFGVIYSPLKSMFIKCASEFLCICAIKTMGRTPTPAGRATPKRAGASAAPQRSSGAGKPATNRPSVYDSARVATATLKFIDTFVAWINTDPAPQAFTLANITDLFRDPELHETIQLAGRPGDKDVRGDPSPSYGNQMFGKFKESVAGELKKRGYSKLWITSWKYQMGSANKTFRRMMTARGHARTNKATSLFLRKDLETMNSDLTTKLFVSRAKNADLAARLRASEAMNSAGVRRLYQTMTAEMEKYKQEIKECKQQIKELRT